MTSYCYAVFSSLYCSFTWCTIKENANAQSHLILIASCRLLEYETPHIGRMWMWLHIRNLVCEQEAEKYCSKLELNWVCETDAFNKHNNAHIHKVTGQQAVTVVLCTRYSGHLRVVWRHQPRTFQKVTIQRRPNVALCVRFLPYLVFSHLQLDLPRGSFLLLSHKNSYPIFHVCHSSSS